MSILKIMIKLNKYHPYKNKYMCLIGVKITLFYINGINYFSIQITPFYKKQG